MQISPDTQLPSLPEVTLRALEACRQEDSYRQISDIISTDTALTARVLALANSSLYGRSGEIRSLEQAMLRLGTEHIRTLVLTASLRQLMFDLGADQWQQLRDFWRHSLTTALMAKTLATLTRYPSADEAFMIGMLHNIGELIALKMAPSDQQQDYLNHQADIGAQLANAWGLGPMAADAMRYQQAPANDIRDAAHLVKLINLSTRLALSDVAGIACAGTIFNLSEDLTRELSLRINREVSSLAKSMGVSLDDPYDGQQANQTLRNTVLRHAMTDQALSFPLSDSPLPELLASTVSNLTLLTGCPSLFFSTKADTLTLVSTSQGYCPEMTVETAPAASILTQCYRDHVSVSSADRKLSVLDRQLSGLLNTPGQLAIPVLIADKCQGVYVIGTGNSDNAAITELASMFCHRLSQLVSEQAQRDTENASAGNLETIIAQDRIRRQIHEISNPLTIIRQYIYQLRERLESDQVREELDVIRDELERAGNMLLQMGGDHQTPVESASPAVLNHELKTLHDLFQDSLFNDKDIECTLSLSTESTHLGVDRAPVRQIIMNLVRNAVECLPQGGQLYLGTAAPIWQHGRPWVELIIEDNGPGLPSEVQKTLFQPVKSHKGKAHSGLGLSIVKQLIDDMEGIIGYRTGSSGTSFRVLLPAAPNHGKD
ncbi:HDOD domain-containing protein [Marinobacter caseinilyticus]|uniref:HDOD domain-containing protein n=1 Tax=Marinobacter caseinilyticus TaxID=2692195 RepID=UPI001409699C|nr:HDOD domain-containing protein [Marinobacter caseinilyticus]